MKISKYLHLGKDVVIKSDEIIGLFDLDNSTVKKSTRDYLSFTEKIGNVVNITLKLPRSFIVVQDSDEVKVYLSQLSTSTLLKRQKEQNF